MGEGELFRIAYIFFDIIMPIGVGYCLKKRSVVSSGFCNGLIRFNIIVVMTALALLSFWTLPLRKELMALPFFAYFNVIVPWLIVKVGRFDQRFTNVQERGSYLITAIPSNVGSLGGLCGYILYGETSFAYIQLMAVFQNLVMFFVLFPMGSYYKYGVEGGAGSSIRDIPWKNVFINKNQLAVVGMVVGAILYSNGIQRPALMGNAFHFLIHFSAWASLVPIGYMIDFAALPAYFKKTAELIPVKVVITPLILYGVSLFFFEDPVLTGTMIIAMAAPCAINALIAVRLYNLNVNLSMAAFIGTNLFYIFVFYPLYYAAVVCNILPFK